MEAGVHVLCKKINDAIQFKTIACCKLTDEELKQCKDLFDHHYGKWGEGSTKEGQRIRFPFRMYEAYRNLDNSFVALAAIDDKIIGQAFYLGLFRRLCLGAGNLQCFDCKNLGKGHISKG